MPAVEDAVGGCAIVNGTAIRILVVEVSEDAFMVGVVSTEISFEFSDKS